MFEQHTGQDQDRLAAATPDDMAWLIEEIKRLQSLLEKEQRARWGAEQNAQHYQEEAEALRLQVAQLAEALEEGAGVLTLPLGAGGMEEER